MTKEQIETLTEHYQYLPECMYTMSIWSVHAQSDIKKLLDQMQELLAENYVLRVETGSLRRELSALKEPHHG